MLLIKAKNKDANAVITHEVCLLWDCISQCGCEIRMKKWSALTGLETVKDNKNNPNSAGPKPSISY